MPLTFEDITYIQSLPAVREHAYKEAQQKWDSGITSEMLIGNWLIIDILKAILIKLSHYYPVNHFNDHAPEEYFSTKISSIFEWHRNSSEPNGHGTGGAIVEVIAGGMVIADLERMGSEIILSLTSDRDDFNYSAWHSEWIKTYSD